MVEMSDDADEPPKPEEERRRRFQRLGEQLTGLLDPESALRRGQGLVTGVSRATKEELMRIVGAEVRSFLDKMDIADLAQQIVAGLEIDVHMQIKLSRSSDGQTRTELTKSDAEIRSAEPRSREQPARTNDKPTQARNDERSEGGGKPER